MFPSSIFSTAVVMIIADDRNHAEKNFSKKFFEKMPNTFFSLSINIHPFYNLKNIISKSLFYFNIKNIRQKKLPDNII